MKHKGKYHETKFSNRKKLLLLIIYKKNTQRRDLGQSLVLGSNVFTPKALQKASLICFCLRTFMSSICRNSLDAKSTISSNPMMSNWIGEILPNKAPIEMRTLADAISAPIKFANDNLIIKSPSQTMQEREAKIKHSKAQNLCFNGVDSLDCAMVHFKKATH